MNVTIFSALKPSCFFISLFAVTPVLSVNSKSLQGGEIKARLKIMLGRVFCLLSVSLHPRVTRSYPVLFYFIHMFQ